MLENEPKLTLTPLLDYLQEHYPEHYNQPLMRTLQRRVKQWRALHGPERDIIFRQQAVVAQQRFSDFTHPDNPFTIQSKTFTHVLYQFCLAYSDWSSVTVDQGGESYAALAAGLTTGWRQSRCTPHG